MKKILVTGATGFVGNYVIKELLNTNCSVIATSSNEDKARLAPWFSQVDYTPFRLEDFDNSVNYHEYFHYPDAMIHLAWQGLPNYNAPFHVEENLPRSFSFLSNCIQHGLSDLTITGTCLEYGMQEGSLLEEMDVKPANPYAIAKDTLRKQLEQLQQQVSFTLKWIRLFYMYGTGQGPNSLLSQLEKALANNDGVFNMSGGEQVRDYLPVEKVAEYLVKIALQNKVTGIINCSSADPVKVKQFVCRYLDERKKTIHLNLGYFPYTDYEPMRFWGNNRKLKSIINE